MVLNKFLLGMSLGTVCTGCSVSFQNISTHGTATDLVDEYQTPTTSIKADASLSTPLTPL